MKKYIIIFSTVIVSLVLLGCKNDKTEQEKISCSSQLINYQKTKLQYFYTLILEKNPPLMELQPETIPNVNIDLKNSIDSLFSDLCVSVLKDELFEKFALIYLYNIKYHESLCCIPDGVFGIITSSFMEVNHFKVLDPYNTSLYYLLKENGISKDNVLMNGFTQSDLHFTESQKKFEDDLQITQFINKVDSIYKSAFVE